MSAPTRNGRRHLLVVYKYMLDRWWRAMLAIGLVLLALAGGLGALPALMPQYTFLLVNTWTLWILAGAGGFSILLAIFLASLRKSAYVQAFGDHLRLVTPFLRLNISYKRIRRTFTSEMGQLFPAKKTGGWKRKLVRPLAAKTVVIIELTSFPVSPFALRLFISPFFFPDKTPRLAILVPDWMAFSTELESRRGAWADASHHPPETPGSKLLASLDDKRG